MGDGRIRREEGLGRKQRREGRTGKQLQADIVAQSRANADGVEAAELASIANVGVRRRRRWWERVQFAPYVT